jgi:hypothetical protein
MRRLLAAPRFLPRIDLLAQRTKCGGVPHQLPEHVGEELTQALADPSLSLRDRVRMACSLGAVSGGLFMAGDAFDNISSAELGSLVQDAVRDLLSDHSA